MASDVPTIEETRKKAMNKLIGYTRVSDGCEKLQELQYVKDVFVLVKKRKRYFTVRREIVDDLLYES